MTYEEINHFAKINELDSDKVKTLVGSMLTNGWVGCPILVFSDSLLTGSHRLAALCEIERMFNDGEIEEYPEILDQEVAEDVTDIVCDSLEKFNDENGYTPDIDYSNIGWLLEGSWVEDYKSEIVEW